MVSLKVVVFCVMSLSSQFTHCFVGLVLFQSFTLEFHFEPNDFFTQTVLTKTYKMRSEPDESDPFSFDGPEIMGCTGYGSTFDFNSIEGIDMPMLTCETECLRFQMHDRLE